MLRSLIDFGRLNLPIIAKFHKKIYIRNPCGCRAKIEAGQIHKLWRSLELRICNFFKNHLTTSTICRSERSAFVVFLEKSKVRIPLPYTVIPYCTFIRVRRASIVLLIPIVTFVFMKYVEKWTYKHFCQIQRMLRCCLPDEIWPYKFHPHVQLVTW